MPKLTVKKIDALKAPGMYLDGQGLYLRIGPTGAKSWILRTVFERKRRDYGVGSTRDITLANARELADAMRKDARAGRDPALRRTKRQNVTFEAAARELHEKLSPTFKNEKHKAQWLSSLKNHAFPVIGSKDIASIQRNEVLEVLSPIWLDMHPTAKRLKQRILAVFNHAIGKQYREALNPVDGALLTSLPKGKKHKPQHHSALAWRDLPGFMVELEEREAMAALCLRFIILTAARSGEARMATWQEISLTDHTWCVPAARMKADEEHRVPLSGEAMTILEAVKGLHQELLFPSPQSASHRSGRPLSVNAFRPLFQRMKREGMTVHGFRSTFRDWCAEKAHADRELAEAALAHKVAGVEGAYFRSDLFERRRSLMDAWGRYATSKTGDVVELVRA